IAKGIRRIIAFTGEDAAAVQRLASHFSERLTALEKLPYSPRKEAEHKTLKAELDSLSISALKKTEFRKKIDKINKDILDHQKKTQKEEIKKAISVVTEYFKINDKATSAAIKLPVTGNPRIIPEVIKHIQSKLKDKNIYLLAADDVSVGPDGR